LVTGVAVVVAVAVAVGAVVGVALGAAVDVAVGARVDVTVGATVGVVVGAGVAVGSGVPDGVTLFSRERQPANKPAAVANLSSFRRETAREQEPPLCSRPLVTINQSLFVYNCSGSL
jgi:hypothetical protein